MGQIIFDDDFKNLKEEPINYWKNKDDIPQNIKKFISEISSNNVFYDEKTDEFFCSQCIQKLDKNFFCKKCKKHYEKINKFIIKIEDINYVKQFIYNFHYYAFDVANNDVILYIINENIYYDNPLSIKPYKTSYLSIDSAFYITNSGFKNLITNEMFNFKTIEKEILNNDCYYENEYETSYLYVLNLDELKNTIYRYSYIWEAKEFLKDFNPDIFKLIYLPIYFKGFEYLIKLKFYSLAFDKPFLLNYDNKAKKLLNDKLSFMIKNNFVYNDFRALQLCDTLDMSLINFISKNLEYIEDILGITNVDLKTLKNYFEKNKLDDEYILEYLDYIKMANELGLDLKSKKILFPDDLKNEHDKLYLEITMINEPKINEKINELSQLLQLNEYQEDNYIIIPASSIESLIDESDQQHNCVRTYCKDYSNNKTQIYFLRKKDNMSKSFVTIEVKNGKVVQARCKYNELPDEKIKKIIDNWEKTIIPINNESSF